MAECDPGANPFVARVFHDCLYECARVLRSTMVVLSYSMLCSGPSCLTPFVVRHSRAHFRV